MENFKMAKAAIEIVDYTLECQPWFEKFNRAWIEKYFQMEPIDVAVLQHPEEHILARGGRIIVAKIDNVIAGVAALKYVEPGVFEFTKMAVDEKFRGLGAGRALAEESIAQAKVLNAHTVILYSNRILKNAIGLYRRLGFVELPIDGVYQRSDIKMKLDI